MHFEIEYSFSSAASTATQGQIEGALKDKQWVPRNCDEHEDGRNETASLRPSLARMHGVVRTRRSEDSEAIPPAQHCGEMLKAAKDSSK